MTPKPSNEEFKAKPQEKKSDKQKKQKPIEEISEEEEKSDKVRLHVNEAHVKELSKPGYNIQLSGIGGKLNYKLTALFPGTKK